MKVVKYSGDTVDFNADKLLKSLRKAGANREQADQIIAAISAQLYDGMATKQIYKLAFGLLKKNSNAHAARYNLREAIRMLGPAGFYFEKYIARLFESEGYRVQTNLVLQGKCVTHEIDVLIQKHSEFGMIECKFHAGREVASDVKVPMYILSRFNDLKTKSYPFFNTQSPLNSCWIVTNNRFTTDAITFANCSGLQLLSWNYPENNGLKSKTDQNKLYPITCLTTLSLAEKGHLLQEDLLLVKDILTHSSVLNTIGLSPNRIQNILKEVRDLCDN
ncbi:Restriction endonuclease [Flavobacterium succinicans]|uniref:Restriction endonuclease n=1 Tax=Flavobacterium succinicans TaxID=29536 RepID=A0A1I4Z899_9FLAO|nr:ATP cone domain-containing protein [Flavobacterium succinicans]SFN46505.1 Restriction endonuclease [Flavobacterium succinicans]